jgi:uncharacterized metal-binding protein YceD (DUF177 family)
MLTPADLHRTTPMTNDATPPASLSFRTTALSSRKPTRFALHPDAAGRAEMAQALDLIGLPRFDFRGELRPAGRHDVVLEARMIATVVQACSVTLAPVTAEIDEVVVRKYLSEFTYPEGEEAEMPEDDTTEPMPEVIDINDVAREALTLALPPYPRAPGVALGEAVFTAPGAAPLRDEDLKPFAGLAGLKDRLGGPKGDA